MSSINLYIVTFDHELKAQKLLDDMESATQEGTFDFIDAAVMIRDNEGNIEISETSDPSTKRGAIVGGVIGGFIGLIGGPAGVGLGAAAGAAIAGFATSKMDLGIPDDELRTIADSLQPGTSAMVVIVKDAWVDIMFSKLSRYNGEVKQQELSQEVIAELLDGTNEDID
jgi:uncharacterized membrane protein